MLLNILQRAGQPMTENHPVPHVSSARAERPDFHERPQKEVSRTIDEMKLKLC